MEQYSIEVSRYKVGHVLLSINGHVQSSVGRRNSTRIIRGDWAEIAKITSHG